MAVTVQDPSVASFAPQGNILALLRQLAAQSPFPVGNASTAQQTGFAADTYLLGSSIQAPFGNTIGPNSAGWAAKGRYTCDFDMTKTAAGTATPIITLRIGPNGNISDTAICTFTFAAGTAAADSGTFELFGQFYSVGSGTSAVFAGVCAVSHNLAATGLTTTGAAGFGQVQTTSAGFSTIPGGLLAPQFIGISFNGGASFSGTNNIVQANLIQP